ncbi:MAG: ABC transporter substrate-binding protein [Alistipes sp.]
MKRFSLFALLLATLTLVGCGGTPQVALSDFTVDVYTPQYAAGFTIAATPKGASTLLTVRNPWQGAQDIQQQIFLARNGEKAPTGFTGQVVHTPVRHVVCMSSSHVAMFEALGEVRRVSGVSGIDYISNSYVNEHKLCGEVRDVGYDTNMNFEVLVTMQPDVVLLYGVSGENPTVTGKLAELGIPYIYVGDYVEESPLGKAEWLVAMSEMCNCIEQGRSVFEGIRDRYNALKDKATPLAKAPRVMLNTPYRDTWFMPSTRSYMVQLIGDAGGEYIYTANTSTTSVPIDLEEAYRLAREADLWLNVGMCATMNELTSQNPKFAEIPVVRAGKVYNNNRRCTPAGGSDFWESGIVCPDKVLSDLIHLFRADTTELYYYQPLR